MWPRRSCDLPGAWHPKKGPLRCATSVPSLFCLLQSLHEQRLIERIGLDGRDQLLRLLGKLTETK